MSSEKKPSQSREHVGEHSGRSCGNRNNHICVGNDHSLSWKPSRLLGSLSKSETASFSSLSMISCKSLSVPYLATGELSFGSDSCL